MRRIFVCVIVRSRHVAAAALLAPESRTAVSAQAPPAGRGGGGGSRPGRRSAQVVRKTMPLDLRVIGTVEASSTVAIRAQITGQLTSVGFKEGDDVDAGRGALHPRSAAARSGAEAGRSEPAARHRAGGERRRAGAAPRPTSRNAGIATREQVDTSQSQPPTRSTATIAADRAAVDNARIQIAVRDDRGADSPAAPAR